MAKSIQERMLKPLNKKQQDTLLQKNETLITRYKQHWEPIFDSEFSNYRQLASGKLPLTVAAQLKKDKYIGKAKLVPRLIADHIEDKTSSIMNATLNRTDPFRFVGQSDGDGVNAENGRKLVMYDWQFTKFKLEARKAIRDCGILGGGWLQRNHFRDRRLKQTFGGNRSFTPNDFDTVYIGPKFSYIRSEMMLPEPNPPGLDFANITSLVKVMAVPISSIMKETVSGGLYSKYSKNAKLIKAEDYDPEPETRNLVSSDHKTKGVPEIEEDFKVLITEWWTSMLDIFGNPLPVWHITTVANWQQNPQFLRCEIDPMANGKHPFYFVRMFDPPEPRLYGSSLAEKLYPSFLEAYFKRNQRIDLVNSASKRAGVMMGPRSAFPPDFITANKDQIVYTNNGKDITVLPTDLSAYQFMMNDELKIEKDAERTAATNPVSMGTSPVRRETATTTATLDQNAKMRTLDPVGYVEQTLICPAAEDSLEHNIVLVPDPYIGRVLGSEREPQFFRFSRRDILGRFDAHCAGSSEITPKAVKMANMTSMIQTYANLPVQFDWSKIALWHFKLSEFPDPETVIITPSNEAQNIERENGMLSVGVPIIPLMHENHQNHIAGHQQYAEQMIQQGADPNGPEISNMTTHNQMHNQMLAQKQGALSQAPQQGSFENVGQLLNDVGSDNQVTAGG